MFGSGILEVTIGMVFIYLLLSLVASAVNELIEGWLKNRAKDLAKGLRELLHDPGGKGLVKAFYEHPLINGLFSGKYDAAKPGNLPSYVPSRNVAMALLDLVPAEGAAAVSSGGGAAAAPAMSVPEPVRRAVRMLTEAAGPDLAKARENVEGWFDTSMQRVSGWYKRRTQVIIFAIGLVLAVAINADSITIANGLANDKALRDSVVAAAQNRENPQAGAQTAAPTPASRPTSTPWPASGCRSAGSPARWRPCRGAFPRGGDGC